MKYYLVQRREIHVSTLRIEADSPEDAAQRVQDGEGDEVTLEYRETVDQPCNIEEDKEQGRTTGEADEHKNCEDDS